MTAERVQVRLLGVPSARVGTRDLPRPRGRKSWAVLATLAMADRPVGRRELARTLFADADDPLGALRWTLAELRRSLGVPDGLRGDPVSIDEDRMVIDARVIDRGGAEASHLAQDASELLEGADLAGCPEFEIWLVVARQRLRSRADGYLRDAAMHALATGDTSDAVRLAGLGVGSSPYDETLHELLIRSLARSGDPVAAQEQATRAEHMIRSGLGVAPSHTLRLAALDAGAPRGSRATAAVVESLIASGHAAVGAGAVDAGIETLRRAAALADGRSLRGRALFALGSALVHGVRGRDEEGAVVLHEGLVVAQAAGDQRTAVCALRELAFVDVQSGRAATVEARLQEALRLAEDDDELATGVLGVQGMHWCDRGDPMRSLEPLTESVERAERARQPRQAAWSRGLTARSLLLLGRYGEAITMSDCSIAGCRHERWQAFLPFPMAMRADAALSDGAELDDIENDLHVAFALGCQLGDPCWEGAAARGLALVSARRGDLTAARATVADGYRRCIRHPDSYVFIEAWVLAADVALAHEIGDEPAAQTSRTRLRTVASRTEQPWFLTEEAVSTAVPLRPRR